MKPSAITRRRFLVSTGASFVAPWVRADLRPVSELGYVIGEPVVEGIGAMILAQGGNAVDALVATALAGAVTQPHQTGIGGYGAHGVFAMDGGKRIAAIDANSTAPAAFTAGIFKPDAKGRVPGSKNDHGWLATGVPGVIAGLKLALDQFGTMPFSEVLQPAVKLTRDGFALPASLAANFARTAAAFKKDPGSAKLYLPGGSAPTAGAVWKNPELAEVLTTLAQANSIEPFYRGDIAQHIADAFAKNGGLVTAKDMAAYHARVVEPLKMNWDEHTIHTAPLTSGGFTVLQMLAILKAMKWDEMPIGLQRTHARIEAMRLAWRDRLTLLGDPEFVSVPQEKLLSDDYAAECAEKILTEVKAGRIIDHGIDTKTQGGTLNFSACDKHGNIAALTLTHGNGFGAQVTVEGLGLTLGHGMSRFDPRPDHPNAPGPGKRPLHNMVPCVITQNGRPVVAIGGRGGRKIPNAILEFLTQYIIEKKSFTAALAAPRLHTEGTKALEFQKAWPATETGALAKLGYQVKTGGSATLSGVAHENGKWVAGMP
ncbi:gamma-glutamyltransferase family protein [Prosthecobacter sp.]|uniref:gamma-glutamyltransferase family protein n=1 Tax=Prosthecobacter sp. TaxID=1965333 RepID=UPI002ABC7D1C|nr:gamma-glutamyltransferase family protein [Prosthecobacter sp.]MDZ4401413.1 gamma-glutamyltransferase family protein [Prosthecobacter sp.]